MKAGDKDKLNQCLDILDTTDLGLSLVWLWTWSVMKNICEDEYIKVTSQETQRWEMLCASVAEGYGFTLEFGPEQHYEEVMDWMHKSGLIEYTEDN